MGKQSEKKIRLLRAVKFQSYWVYVTTKFGNSFSFHLTPVPVTSAQHAFELLNLDQ
jgi:hypothetical protein